MTTLFIQFVIFNVLNVIIQTVKSIATIKCGKMVASIVNAVAYGLYTYIIVLTNCELSLLTKCLVVASASFIGVYAVKYFEEKARKDKLWKVELTVPVEYTEAVNEALVNIPHSFLYVNTKYTLFNAYCGTQAESIRVKQICDRYEAKYFVSESKTL
jgi:uncharacterized protein YebE (UPF0316 family)